MSYGAGAAAIGQGLIGLIGNLISSKTAATAVGDENFVNSQLAQKANYIQNYQWKKEEERKREDTKREAYSESRSAILGLLASAPKTQKAIADIFAGRR